MAFDISLSAGMRADLISLQGTAKLLNRTQGRLSSGKNVNSAVDDPSKFFAAADHTNHASDLSARKSDMGEGIQTVKAANQGITSINTLINQARGLVQSAQSSNGTTRASLAAQFNDLRTQIDQLAQDSGYNGKNFLKSDTLTVLFNENGSSFLQIKGFQGDSTGLGIQAAASSLGAQTETATTKTAVASDTYVLHHSGTVAKADVTVTQTVSVAAEALVGATSATTINGASVNLGHIGQASAVTVSETISATSAGVFATGGASAGATVDLAATSAAPTNVTVTVQGGADLQAGVDYSTNYANGKLTITMMTDQSANALDVTYDFKKTLNATTDYTLGAGTATAAGKINFVGNHSGAISVDYTFKGAVATGSFSVAGGTANTAATVTFNATVSGSVEVTYGKGTAALWGDDAAIATDLNNLNTAINNLRTQASTLAANLSVVTTRQEWSQGMIDNLQQGADSLTLADMNEEGANMLALQTRQQLGIQALSLASQANQSIMRLFG